MMRKSKFSWTLLIVAVLALPTPFAQADTPPTPPRKITSVEGITEYQLANGLRVLLFPDPSTSKVTVNATVFVGSRHEGYGETGMAHLLEHMVFKGTEKHPNVPKVLNDRGARFNGTTWVDRTNYYETMNASDANLEFGIQLEADRLFNSFIRREDLVSEMTVVRNEFERGENDPSNVLSQRIMGAAYEWHNYGKSTIGNRSDIERVPIENLQAFYKKYYRPDNMMLVVAGNFQEEKALALINKYFGSIKNPSRPLDQTYTEEPAQDGERNVVLRRVGTSGEVGAVFHIPAAAHPDFPAVEVLATMLALEPSGPLYKGLVETKKAVKASAIAFGWHDPGVLEIGVEVDKKQSVEEVRDLLLQILDKVSTESNWPQAEVDRAKARLEKNRELQMIDSNSIGIALSDWGAKGDWRLFFLHRDRLAKVTPADISRVAGQYLTRNNRTVGMFIPTDSAQRAAIPATPDIAKMVESYKGGKAVTAGETFDPTPENIEQRLRRTQLTSGIKVAMLPKKMRGEAVTLRLTLNYGNADSLKGHTSATQLLAPMLLRGCKGMSRQEIEDRLDKLKARLVPGGLLGVASFQIDCKRENLKEVLEILGRVLLQPTFPASEFEILKRQLRDGLERQSTEPQILAVRALQRKLTPVEPDNLRYVPTIAESLARLEAVTLEEVQALYQQQIGGENGELVVIGEFEPDVILAQLNGYFKDWKARTSYRRTERPAIEGIQGERIEIKTPDKANAFYLAGLTFPMKDNDPAYPGLEMSNYVLGGGILNSRLATRVRQKEGISYTVASQFIADSLDPLGRFQMVAIYNPENKKRVNTAISEELTRLLKEGITPAELEAAKIAILAASKQARGTDTALLAILQETIQAGRTLAFNADFEKKIKELTVETANEAFRKYIDPSKLVIVQAGDFDKPAEATRPAGDKK